MKLRVYVIAIFFIGFFQVSGQPVKEYEDFLKSGIKLSTKEIVYSQLDLAVGEVEAFDKIFDRYLDKRSAIAKERLPVMVEYVMSASTMSDEQLKEFNRYLMSTNMKLIRLNKKFYNKARRVIPIQKATSLFLVEKLLRNAVELELMEELFVFSF